jgi:hypothetical protein
MKTNTTINTNTPALTIGEAVIEAVNELKVKGSFSAHDVTSTVREAVNAGEFILPGFEATPNQSGIKYWINHEDVKAALDSLLNDGTLNNLGLVDVSFNGSYRVFNFTDTTTVNTVNGVTTAANTTAPDDVDSPLQARVKAYLNKVGSATLKQVQSAVKVNGITCKDFAEIVENLGYNVSVGTDGCFSTYVVS